jgi:hypothetical protein
MKTLRNFRRTVPRSRTLPAFRQVLLVSLAFATAAAVHAAVPALVSNINDSGSFSLRGAVLSGSNTILFDSSFFNTPKTITLTSGEIVIDHDVTIIGPGVDPATGTALATISGNHISRIFNIQPTASGPSPVVDISSLKFTDGLAPLTRIGTPSMPSYLANPGGAIFNTGTLSIEDCSFSNNTAHDTSGKTSGDNGGAIHNSSQLLITRCTFDNNTANGGGAINNTGGLSVKLSTFTENSVTFGGNGGGGAILNRGNAMFFASCTIADNTADGFGGGIYNDFSSGSPLPTAIVSTIIATNHAPTSPDVFGAYGSADYNFIGISDNGNGFTKPNDQSGTAAAPADPRLNALAYNGGLTFTMALQSSSPAIDQGNNDSTITTDQRGFTRRVNIPLRSNAGDGSDVGAYELNPPVVETGNATNVTAQSATLNGTVNPNGATTNASFEYGTSTSYGSSTATQNIGSGYSVMAITADISGLAANTTYHFRIVGTSIAGKTTGTDQTFTTPLTGTATPTPTPNTLLNISTRLRVLTGDNVLIGGFIITGSDAKKVLIRGIGPSLINAGVQGALADPTLELHQGSSTIYLNDNWKDTQQAEIEATTIPPSNDLESAIVITLQPGAYTAILRGQNNGIGVGLIEVYDLAQQANSKMANISTRGFVDTGDNVMIGGFIVGGDSAGHATVVARGIGPSLAGSGVANPLQDPTLELHNGQGTTIQTNDNWKDTQQTEIEQSGLAPTNDAESALVATLAPGNYTVILSGKADGTGIGLVEVYQLQ